MHRNYFKLVKKYPLRSIKSKEESMEASEVLTDLLRRELLEGELDYFEALEDLISLYEQSITSEPVSGPEVIKSLMGSNKLTYRALAGETALSYATIAHGLSGKKPFSLRSLQRIATYFNVPVETLI